MAAIADRVKQSSTTTGSGAITLTGAVAGFRTFNDAFGVAVPCHYAILDANGTAWEVGVGQLTDATHLARTTVEKSSNANAAIVLTAGTHAVFSTLSEGWADTKLDAGLTTLAGYGITDAVNTSALDTDGTLTANSDAKVATQKATKTYVTSQVAALVASAPGTLDTLNELATALGDDPSFATTIATSLGTKEVAANKNASGGYAGLTLFKLNLRNAANTITSWFTTAATVARTWTMPDKDGTVAMTSDITGTNTGTNTGDQTISLTGDVTGSGTGSFAATIAADAVTYAKMQNVSATDKVLGRSTAGAGDVEEIACTAAGRALIDDADAAAQRTTLGLGTLATQSGTFSGASSGTNTGDQASVPGNAGSATVLATPRAINGVAFDGSAPVTVTAAAGTLSGATLAAGVTASSLTSVGTLTSLALGGAVTGVTDLTTTGNTVLGNASTDTLNVGNGGIIKDASGNVGIGVTPTTKLDVYGNYVLFRNLDYLCYFGNGTLNGVTAATFAFRSDNGPFSWGFAGNQKMSLDQLGNLVHSLTDTTPTLANSQMVFTLTSNTNLRVSVRGTDGTTRTANITLA